MKWIRVQIYPEDWTTVVIVQYVFSHQDVNIVALLLRSCKMKRAGRKVQNSVASGIAYEGCMLRLEASARLP